MSYPREIKEYYRDAFQQVKNHGDTSLSFSEFVLQERDKILSIVEKFESTEDGKKVIDWVGVVKKLREDGKVSKFIPLATLQKIVQFSGKKGFELEGIFDFPSNTVTQNEELRQTAVPRIDDLVQSQSDSEFTFAVEWISNAIDAVSPHKQIGRFGEGFFQSLQHLQDEGNEIQVTSKTEKDEAYKVSLQKRGTHLYVAPEQHDTSEKGTSVSLKKSLGKTKRQKLEIYIASKFRANTRAIITMNGKQVNNFGDYTYINGQDAIKLDTLPHISIELDENGVRVTDSGVGMNSEDLAGKLLYPNTTSKKREKVSDEDVKKLSPDETRFFYTNKKDKKDKTHISLQVAGVIIEDFHVPSVGNIGECVFEFPSFSPLEDSRNEIKVGRETTIGLVSALEKISTKAQNLEEKLGLLEVIGSIYHHLKDRPTNIVDEDFTLETNMKKSFKSIQEDIESSGVTILPADEKMMNIFGKRDDVFYIDPDFIDFAVESIPGISEISESVLGRSTTKTGKQVRFFEVDFDSGSTHDYLLGDEYVLINKTAFAEKTDEQRDMLIQVINIGVNLNTSYELSSERVSYGRLPTSSEGEIVAKAPKKKTKAISLDDIQKRKRGDASNRSGEKIEEYDYVTEIAYIDQELEVFGEKYISKFPKAISDRWSELLKKKQRPQFQDQQVKDIRGLLQAGRSIENVVKRLQLSMMLKISRLGLESGQTDEIYTLLSNFLESKNSSHTSPTFEFLSSLAESMVFQDTSGFIRYIRTLFKALEQDPKNVVILLKEFTPKRMSKTKDYSSGHMELILVEVPDTSAFGVFQDIIQEKQKSLKIPEQEQAYKDVDNYKLDINKLNIISEDLFSSGSRRENWATKILDKLPELSGTTLSKLRQYLLDTDVTELNIEKIETIIGTELLVLEAPIDMFACLQAIFIQENTNKEIEVWDAYREGSWLNIDYFNRNINRGDAEQEEKITTTYQFFDTAVLREKTISKEAYLRLRKLVYLSIYFENYEESIKNSIDSDIGIIIDIVELSIEWLYEYFQMEVGFHVDFSEFPQLLKRFGYDYVDGYLVKIEENTNKYVLNAARLSKVAKEQISEGIRNESSIDKLIVGLDFLPSDTFNKYRKLLLSDNNLDLSKVKKVFDQTSFEDLYRNIPSEKWLLATNMLRIVFEAEEKKLQELSEEGSESIFPADWERQIEKLCFDYHVPKMSKIIQYLQKNKSLHELRDFKKEINNSGFKAGYLKNYLEQLEYDAGSDFTGGINFDNFLGYFQVLLEGSEGDEKLEEAEEYFFPVDWERKLHFITGETEKKDMVWIIETLHKYKTSAQLQSFRNSIITNQMDELSLKDYLQKLEGESDIDLTTGIDFYETLKYFWVFFNNEEDGLEYIPDIHKLSSFITEVFSDPEFQKSSDMTHLSAIIQNLYELPTLKLYEFRKLLLERNDFSIREINDVLSSSEYQILLVGIGEENEISTFDMLKTIFEYELDQHEATAKKSESKEIQNTGTYKFPDNIIEIINIVVPESDSSLNNIIRCFVADIGQDKTSSEAFDIRESILSGSLETKGLISLFEELSGNSGLNSDAYLSFDSYTDVLNYLKDIFEYEIDQKEWDTYYKHSYLNPYSNIGEVSKSERHIYDTLLDLRKRAGDIQFMRLFTDIRRKVYLLDYIGGFNNIEKAGQEMGFTVSEIQDIKEKLQLSLNHYFTEKDIGYDQLSEYLENEFNFKADDYDNMLLTYDHTQTLKKLGYTPTIPTKESSERNKEKETQNISDIKLSEEFFMSLSGKYDPQIIAFAQFLESNGEYLSPKESKVAISESGVISTSLSQIISTSFGQNATISEGVNLGDFTGLLGQGEAGKQFNDIIAGVCLAQDEVSMYFLREGIQNARDALISAGKSDKPIEIDAYDRDGKFATSVSDSVGMELGDIITKLLTPYNSGKNGIDSTGKFGKGFFTFAVGCSELRIKSSTGNGTVNYIKMIPQMRDGIIYDFEVFIEEKQEDYTGTTIERVDEFGGIHGNLRALIGTHLLKKYVANTQEVEIDFAGTVINSPQQKTLVEESESILDADGKAIGKLRIYTTKDKTERFTKDNLWISEIKEDIINDFPDWIIDFIRQQKYSFDIPSGTPLVGSRNSLENREHYVNLFKPHIYRMVIEIVLNEHLGKNLRIPMMPEDYLALLKYDYAGNNEIDEIAKKYNMGKDLSSHDIDSLKDKAHMAQFLTEVEFTYKGKITSLRAIKKDIHDETIERQKYGQRFQGKIVQANQQKEGLNQTPEKYNLSYDEITELTGLSEAKVRKLKNFIMETLASVITERFGGEYHISFHRNEKGGEIASSYGNEGFGCSFRVDTREFKGLVENISSPKTRERVMDIVAHEMTHNVEDTLGTRKWGTHETDELHDASFMRINREIITQLGRGVGLAT